MMARTPRRSIAKAEVPIIDALAVVLDECRESLGRPVVG